MPHTDTVAFDGEMLVGMTSTKPHDQKGVSTRTVNNVLKSVRHKSKSETMLEPHREFKTWRACASTRHPLLKYYII